MFSLNAANHAYLKSGQFIATLDQRQSPKIACLQEIAWRNGVIAIEKFEQLAQPLDKNGYGQYRLRLSNKEVQL